MYFNLTLGRKYMTNNILYFNTMLCILWIMCPVKNAILQQQNLHCNLISFPECWPQVQVPQQARPPALRRAQRRGDCRHSPHHWCVSHGFRMDGCMRDGRREGWIAWMDGWRGSEVGFDLCLIVLLIYWQIGGLMPMFTYLCRNRTHLCEYECDRMSLDSLLIRLVWTAKRSL